MAWAMSLAREWRVASSRTPLRRSSASATMRAAALRRRACFWSPQSHLPAEQHRSRMYRPRMGDGHARCAASCCGADVMRSMCGHAQLLHSRWYHLSAALATARGPRFLTLHPLQPRAADLLAITSARAQRAELRRLPKQHASRRPESPLRTGRPQLSAGITGQGHTGVPGTVRKKCPQVLSCVTPYTIVS